MTEAEDAAAVVARQLANRSPADRATFLRELLAHTAAGLVVTEGNTETAEVVYSGALLMADPLSIGDIVHLRSGSPDLTVTAINDGGYVDVAWFVDDYAQEDSYPVEALMLKHAPATVVQLKRG